MSCMSRLGWVHIDVCVKRNSSWQRNEWCWCWRSFRDVNVNVFFVYFWTFSFQFLHSLPGSFSNLCSWSVSVRKHDVRVATDLVCVPLFNLIP